ANECKIVSQLAPEDATKASTESRLMFTPGSDHVVGNLILRVMSSVTESVYKIVSAQTVEGARPETQDGWECRQRLRWIPHPRNGCKIRRCHEWLICST